MLQVCCVVRGNNTQNYNTQTIWDTFLHVTNVMRSKAIVTYERLVLYKLN